jgi:hypothetical protein
MWKAGWVQALAGSNPASSASWKIGSDLGKCCSDQIGSGRRRINTEAATLVLVSVSGRRSRETRPSDVRARSAPFADIRLAPTNPLRKRALLRSLPRERSASPADSERPHLAQADFRLLRYLEKRLLIGELRDPHARVRRYLRPGANNALVDAAALGRGTHNRNLGHGGLGGLRPASPSSHSARTEQGRDASTSVALSQHRRGHQGRPTPRARTPAEAQRE